MVNDMQALFQCVMIKQPPKQQQPQQQMFYMLLILVCMYVNFRRDNLQVPLVE